MKSISDSTECCKSELDLFYSLPTNTSITSSSYMTVSSNPLSGNEENFEINVNGSDEYTDLSDIFMKLEIEITNEKAFDETEFKIGPINNLGHSLFKKIDLSIGSGLNKKLVEIGSSHYAYKAYLLNHLNYGVDAKEGWMQSGLYYNDTHNLFNNTSIEREEKSKVKKSGGTDENDVVEIIQPIIFNNGYVMRRKEFVDGKGTIKLIIPLHCDFLHSNRFLLNNIGLFFQFERNKHNFILMGDGTDFKIKIKKADMMVRKCQIHETVKLAHLKALEIADAKYPIKQNKVYVSGLDDGTNEYTINTYGSYIPNRIICGLVLDSAYNGILKENPFNFEAYKLESITLIINDISRVIKINTSKNDYSEGYHSLCESLNIYGDSNSIIKKTEYSKGNSFFCFNLMPDKGCNEQYDTIKMGNLQLKLNFSEAVEKKLRLISIMEYDNQININKKMEVSFDYDL